MELGPIIFDLTGTQLNSDEKKLLQHPLVGGVILFTRNYDNVEQLVSLVADIKSQRPGAIVMVDQEGGRVQRFKEGFTRMPSLRLIGRLFDSHRDSPEEIIQLSYQLGVLMALEIKSTGIDFSLAPVVDLDRGLSEVIGERAFHSDPDGVALLAKSYIAGMQAAGMLATIKHFPGHGSVTLDSHHELPTDNRAISDIAQDMMPFRDLIKESNVKAVMPAHIVYKQCCPLPAGFSSYWLQDVLRGECGFKGAIISDDMSMRAADIMGDYPRRASKALEAGCDLVLVCNHREGVLEILEQLQYRQSLESSLRVKDLCSSTTPTFDKLNNDLLWLKAKEGLKKFEGLCACLNPTLV